MATNVNAEPEMELDLDFDMDMELEPEMDMNLDRKKCEGCGGDLMILRFDMNHIYYQCKHCGQESRYTFKSVEEAEFYLEDAKQALFGKLREGFVDWRMTNWDQLHDEFIEFINQHPDFENDLQLKMAIVACVTKGFNLLDAANYRQSRLKFKVVDRMYKQRLKVLRAQMKNPVLSESMEDYKMSRAKYVELRNQYLQTKMAYKLLWSVVKGFFK